MPTDDPMDEILSRYERFEAHPLGRLRRAAIAGGLHVKESRMGHIGIVNEINHDGMCVGFITKRAAGDGYNLELSKKEAPAEAIAAASQSIERSMSGAQAIAVGQQAEMRFAF